VLNNTLILSLDSPAVRSAGSVKFVDGVPVARFTKPVIPVGKFTKRDKRTGEKLWDLDVTPARQQQWIDTFQAMKAGGKPVKLMDDTGAFTVDAPASPLTKNHAGAFEKGEGARVRRLARLAENVVGDTVDMFIEDGWVTAVVEVKGQTAIDLVTRNKDTSPEIDRCMVDGKPAEIITAISIVPNPLVPGQTGFQPIAASDDEPERFILSLDTGDTTMKVAEVLAAAMALAASVGISGPVTEDNAHDILGQCRAKFGEQKDQLTKVLSDEEPDLKNLGLVARLAEKEIDRLKTVVSDAGIADLKSKLVGDVKSKKFSSFILSAEDPDDAVTAIEGIVDTILKHPAVTKGAKTPRQNTEVLADSKALSDEEGQDAAAKAADKIVDAHIKSMYGHVGSAK
jgi:hypothetical protein